MGTGILNSSSRDLSLVVEKSRPNADDLGTKAGYKGMIVADLGTNTGVPSLGLRNPRPNLGTEVGYPCMVFGGLEYGHQRPKHCCEGLGHSHRGLGMVAGYLSTDIEIPSMAKRDLCSASMDFGLGLGNSE